MAARRSSRDTQNTTQLQQSVPCGTTAMALRREAWRNSRMSIPSSITAPPCTKAAVPVEGDLVPSLHLCSIPGANGCQTVLHPALVDVWLAYAAICLPQAQRAEARVCTMLCTCTSYRRTRRRSSVLLPLPLLPTMAQLWPGSTRSVTPRSTSRSGVYPNRTSRRSSARPRTPFPALHDTGVLRRNSARMRCGTGALGH